MDAESGVAGGEGGVFELAFRIRNVDHVEEEE